MGVVCEFSRHIGHRGRACRQQPCSACRTARTAARHHETADDYTGVVARLCARHRVIICKDNIQWIIQRKDAERAGRPRWASVRYFRTRNELIEVSRTVCARVDPKAMATLVTLPRTIGGAP
jgi:hypothetical protein